MIVEIKCAVCNEVVGTLNKPTITAADLLKCNELIPISEEESTYSVLCSNGHGGSFLLVEPE